MTKKSVLGMLFAALLAAAGCHSGSCSPSRIALTEKDDGRQLQLVRGDTLTVELKSNPTTGYCWLFAANEYDVLRVETTEFIAPDTDRCGAPGRERLRFKAVKAGETTLHLVYVRPWEKKAPPAQSFRVKVSVAEPR